MTTQRKAEQALTPLELEIMQVLWEAGPSTVSEVQPRLKAQLAYTTVQTMLNVLLRKDKVKRVQEGRAFRYRAVVSRERATGNALKRHGDARVRGIERGAAAGDGGCAADQR